MIPHRGPGLRILLHGERQYLTTTLSIKWPFIKICSGSPSSVGIHIKHFSEAMDYLEKSPACDREFNKKHGNVVVIHNIINKFRMSLYFRKRSKLRWPNRFPLVLFSTHVVTHSNEPCFLRSSLIAF